MWWFFLFFFTISCLAILHNFTFLHTCICGQCVSVVFFRQVHVHVHCIRKYQNKKYLAMWISECNICALTRGTILWQAKCTRYICTDKGVVTQNFFFNLKLFQLRNVILLVNILWIWFMNKTNVCREIKLWN